MSEKEKQDMKKGFSLISSKDFVRLKTQMGRAVLELKDKYPMA